MARSIQLKYELGQEGKSIDINFDANGRVKVGEDEYAPKVFFTVEIDPDAGIEDNDSFTIHPIEEDWIEITQDKTAINVFVRRNRTLQPRTCVITIEHNAWLSDDAFAYANVTQEAMECEIEVVGEDSDFIGGDGKYEVKKPFKVFPGEENAEDEENNDKNGKTEEKTCAINVKGGSEKIRILSVKKCYDKEVPSHELVGYRETEQGGASVELDVYEELSDLEKRKYPYPVYDDTGEPVSKPFAIQNDGCVSTEIQLDKTYTGDGKKYKLNLISYGRTFFKYEDADPYYLITVAHNDDLSKQLQFKVKYDEYAAHGDLEPVQQRTVKSVKPKKARTAKAPEPVVEVIEPVVPSFVLDIDTDTIEFIHGERESITIPYTAVPEGSVLWIRTSSSLITGDYDAENVILRISPKAWGVEKKVGISIANVNCQNLRYDLTGVIKAL